MPAAILPAVSPDTLAAALGAQRLRLAAAGARDPFALPCWTPAPAYAPATGYVPGSVVASSGRLYVAVSGGVSPAAGAAPSHTDGSAMSDGAVLWTHAGPAPATGVDPAAPTLTISAVPPALANTVAALGDATVAIPGALRPVGGYPFNYGGYLGLRTLDRGVDVVGQHIGWEFETDEDRLCIGIFGGSAPVQLVIDGRRWSPGGVAMPSGGENYLSIGFPGQERRARRFRIELADSSMALHDIRVAGTGQIWAPATERVRAVFIADSILAGSAFGPCIAGGSVAQRVAGALGWTDPWDFSIGGTGYVNAGAGSRTYRQRVTEALTRAPDVWVFMGSGNDAGQPAAAITAAALATFRSIRAGRSSAPVIVLGVWPKDGAALAVETAVKAAFDAFADANSAWVPIAGDPSGVPWITGAWNNAAHPASTNAGQLIGGDGTHPVDFGSAYLARRIVRAIRAEVLPRLWLIAGRSRPPRGLLACARASRARVGMGGGTVMQELTSERAAAPPSLTVVILTFNEGRHIARAIDSVRGLAAEIVVVDSFSRDATVALATAAGARVLQNPFVTQAKQFQWAMDHAGVTTDWVLRLDADEVIGEDLRAELARALPSLPGDVVGINLPRRHIFMDRWIRHGGRYPLWMLRVFRRGHGRVEDRWMDEHIVVWGGRTIALDGVFEDRNLHDLGFFTAKHNAYAVREAVDVLIQRYGLSESRGAPPDEHASAQARLKRWMKLRVYNRLPFGVGPFALFAFRYIVQLGFLDGRSGLIYHTLQGFWYRFLVDAKVLEFDRGMADCTTPAERRARLAELSGFPV